jgi:hypothetical protein
MVLRLLHPIKKSKLCEPLGLRDGVRGQVYLETRHYKRIQRFPMD